MSGWRLGISGCHYVVLCVVGSLVVRAINCIFKAFAILDGEHLAVGETNDFRGFDGFWKAFGVGFIGFVHPSIRDLWLPFLIGVAELAAYPVLFFRNDLLVIGGWIIVKTAGSWGVWARSRTAYNRFLFGNVLIIAISYLWLSRYIVKV